MQVLTRYLNPLVNTRAIVEALGLLRRALRLSLNMTTRDLTLRHAGGIGGLLWVIVHPLFLTCLYVFIFAVVFKQKIGGTRELPLDYTTYILSGLIPWLSLQSALQASTMSVAGNAALVKQFTFPIEALVLKDVLASLVIWLVGVPVIVVYVLLTQGALFVSYALLPVALVLQLLLSIGLAFALSASTVFFRDLKELITIFSTAGMFLLPIVYLPDWIPALFRPIVYANPFSYLIWVYQDILYFGRMEHPVAWLVSALIAVVAFAAGFRVFRRFRPHFGMVL